MRAACFRAGAHLTPPPSLVYSSSRFMPIKLRAFLDFALPRLAAGC
jgi:hypothetical protein